MILSEWFYSFRQYQSIKLPSTKITFAQQALYNDDHGDDDDDNNNNNNNDDDDNNNIKKSKMTYELTSSAPRTFHSRQQGYTLKSTS